MRGASLRGGKMRGTVQGINARRCVICDAGMCEAQRTTGAAGVVIGCEPSSHHITWRKRKQASKASVSEK